MPLTSTRKCTAWSTVRMYQLSVLEYTTNIVAVFSYSVDAGAFAKRSSAIGCRWGAAVQSMSGRIPTGRAQPRDERPVRGPFPPCSGERAHRSRSPRRLRRVRPRPAAPHAATRRQSLTSSPARHANRRRLQASGLGSLRIELASVTRGVGLRSARYVAPFQRHPQPMTALLFARAFVSARCRFPSRAPFRVGFPSCGWRTIPLPSLRQGADPTRAL